MTFADVLFRFGDRDGRKPLSTPMDPQRIFRRVVFPEPLLPTTDMNSFFAMAREKSAKRVTSFTEFLLKVL